MVIHDPLGSTARITLSDCKEHVGELERSRGRLVLADWARWAVTLTLGLT